MSVESAGIGILVPIRLHKSYAGASATTPASIDWIYSVSLSVGLVRLSLKGFAGPSG